MMRVSSCCYCCFPLTHLLKAQSRPWAGPADVHPGHQLKPALGDKSDLGKPLHTSPKYQFDLPRQLQSQGGFGFRSSTCLGWLWHCFPLGRARGEGRGPRVPRDLLGWRPGRLARVLCDIIVPWELLKTSQAKHKTHKPTLKPLILFSSFSRNAGSGVRQTVVFRVLGKEVHHNIS